ncbi:hypothetical protein DFH29DRAFT_1083716 [Suillus ampliporus]|nr:hypothetical protein DFH29DRAFT_1083716 [Suillus ampliporus]
MYPDVEIAQRVKSPQKSLSLFFTPYFTALMFADNVIRLELPLKYPETIRITFIPDVPGPLTIEIIPSTSTTTKPPDTPKEKSTQPRTFIGPGIDDSVTEPESEVEQGAPDVADKTVVNISAGVKRPGSPLVSHKSRTTKY